MTIELSTLVGQEVLVAGESLLAKATQIDMAIKPPSRGQTSNKRLVNFQQLPPSSANFIARARRGEAQAEAKKGYLFQEKGLSCTLQILSLSGVLK